MADETDLPNALANLQMTNDDRIEAECCGNGCHPCVLDLAKQSRSLKRITRPIFNEIFSRAFLLDAIQSHSHNSFIYTFQTLQEHSDQVLGLDFDHYLMMKGFNKNNELIYRAYTPLYKLEDFENGIFRILIKIYPNGIMSNFIKNLKPKDLVYFRGPYNKYNIKPKLKSILILAGGTGVIPCLNIITKIIELELDTLIKLYFCIHCYEDILMKDEIKELNSFWNVEIIFCLTEISDKVPFYNAKMQSRLNLENIEFKSVSEIIICGPEKFNIEIKRFCEIQDIKNEHLIIL